MRGQPLGRECCSTYIYMFALQSSLCKAPATPISPPDAFRKSPAESVCLPRLPPAERNPFSLHNLCLHGRRAGVLPGRWLGPWVMCRALEAAAAAAQVCRAGAGLLHSVAQCVVGLGAHSIHGPSSPTPAFHPPLFLCRRIMTWG